MKKRYLFGLFWVQGFSNSPELVQMCVSHIKTLSTSYPVIELSLDNIDKYVIIPNVILNKYKNGIISQAHFADFLRFNLLKDYGGFWMYATVYQHDYRTMDALTD